MDHGAFNLDQRIRLASLPYLAQQAQNVRDGVLPRTLLVMSSTFDGFHVSLTSQQSAFMPAVLPAVSRNHGPHPGEQASSPRGWHRPARESLEGHCALFQRAACVP